MKEQLHKLLSRTLAKLQQAGELGAANLPTFTVERTRNAQHGDFASNAALILAHGTSHKPRELAELVVAALPADRDIAKVEIAGPGFINLFLAPHAFHAELRRIHEQGPRYGRNTGGDGHRVGIEFVSANPTGPLHVGHGRAAVIGDCLARLLDANGWEVTREYYYNDGGGQINNLIRSVQARCRGSQPGDPGWPEDGYRGDYIAEIARAYLDGDTVRSDGIDAQSSGDVEDEGSVCRFAVAWLRREQDQDLQAFGVHFDVYFLESSLYTEGKVEETVAALAEQGHTYEQDGALWLRSTDFGDDKDRVMRKSDGSYTYFVPDVAYHRSKWQRGYARAITELGADHHGSLKRVHAGLQALGAGIPQDWPEYVLHQMVTVMRGGAEVKISKRAGSYVTLRDLIDEVGRDAARYFLIARKVDSQLVFDVDLALSQSNDNPVYYCQYAHARVCSVMRQLQERGLQWNRERGLAHLDRLDAEHEKALLAELSRYPEVVEAAAQHLEPHVLAQYLRDLAALLHGYYNSHQFLVEDGALRDARLTLIEATRQVLANGLELLGLSAPEKM